MRVLPAIAAAVVALAAPAAQSATPRALGILTTGSGLDISPASVGPYQYTVQIHNIGQYPMRVRMLRTFTVLVPAGGWAFRVVHFRVGTYQVMAAASHQKPWISSVSVNP